MAAALHPEIADLVRQYETWRAERMDERGLARAIAGMMKRNKTQSDL